MKNVKTFKPISISNSSPPKPRTGWTALIGLGIICLGFGIGLTSKLSTLTCNRVETSQITCSTLEEDLLELDVTRTTLEKVQRAEIRIRLQTAGETEKLVLVGEKREMKLEAFDGNAQEAAISINDFIADINEESVTLSQDDRWFSAFFGIVLAIAGLFQTGLLKFSNPRLLNRS